MNLEQVLNKAIEKAVKQAKLELYPVGSYWLTEGSQNPADVIGGGYGRRLMTWNPFAPNEIEGAK